MPGIFTSSMARERLVLQMNSNASEPFKKCLTSNLSRSSLSIIKEAISISSSASKIVLISSFTSSFSDMILFLPDALALYRSLSDLEIASPTFCSLPTDVIPAENVM